MRRAFVGGVSVLDENTMNALLDMQDYSIIFEGDLYDSNTGAGAVENSLADYSYYIRFTAPADLGYIQIEADRDGTGSDIEYEIRDNTFNPDGSNDGVLVYGPKIYPDAFVDTTAGYINIYVGSEGLSTGNNYWLVLKKAGSAVNKIDVIGETTTNASYPVYKRAGDSGAWTSSEEIHIMVYEWTEKGKVLISEEGGQIDWFDYTGNVLSELRSYTPAINGDESKSIRQRMSITGLRKGVVSNE